MNIYEHLECAASATQRRTHRRQSEPSDGCDKEGDKRCYTGIKVIGECPYCGNEAVWDGDEQYLS